MATYEQARSAIAEHAARQWRLRALERCSGFLDAGDHAAAVAAYRVAGSDPFAYAPLRHLVDQLALSLATPAAPAIQ